MLISCSNISSEIILECPPLYEIDPHNTTLCKMCGIGKITVTYDNQPCIFKKKKKKKKKKKHQDTHAHNLQNYVWILEIFYQIILFITMKPNAVKKQKNNYNL